MYIAVYGIVEYKMIGAHYGNKIMEEKQKIMNYLEKNPHCLKDTNKKITKVAFQEIMSEFMVDRKTSLHSFIAMCKFYKQNVIIVNKNTYMEFIVSPEEIPVIFIGKTTGKNDTFYEIDLDTTHTKIDGIKNTKWLIENTEKPLKGIGTYSVLELQYIIQKLQIRLDDHKYKKMELYELIIHCVCA
jgi:hypothetical protein